jgi:transposase
LITCWVFSTFLFPKKGRLFFLYPAHYLARRLKALGWSTQQPAVYARERDNALVRAWLIPGPFILIWDRLNAHRATVVKEYLSAHPEIEVHWLPPYAPDLNPEEGFHRHVKPHLRKAQPSGVSDLRAGVDRGFARLRRRPALIRGFFRHAGLNVNQIW